MRWKIISLLLIFGLASWKMAAQDHFCGIQNNSFKNKEKLTYQVFYNMGFIWVGAGVVSFTVNQISYQGKPVYHIVGKGRTHQSYDWFYRVRDRYETYLDTATLLPQKFIRKVEEGGTKKYSNINFDHEAGKATSTEGVFKIPRCVQDVLSAIYYSRNVNYDQYQPGTKIPFRMFLDDQVYELYIRYLGKEKITTRFGTYNAIKFSPLLIEGTIFRGGEGMTVWVSDDANKIPVRIESPIMIGSIKVDLSNYEHIRHPLQGLCR